MTDGIENCQPKTGASVENCQPKAFRCGCGGEAKVFTYDALSGEQLYYINCTKCGICTSSKLTKAEAIQEWNRAMSGKVQDCAKNARSSDPDDLISRQDAINAMMALKHDDDEGYGCEIPEGFDGKRAVEALEKLPSAEPERKKGEWITHDYALGRERYECTECRGRCDLEYNFCPHCGADTRGDHE